MSYRIFIMAGEASGDFHGASLARALRERQPDMRLAGLGSHHMREAGVEILHDLTPHAAIGVFEVLSVMRRIHKVFRQMVARLDSERPDAVVLIDYPMFNLRFARQAHERGIPVVYYVSPQIWAWNQRRAYLMARYVDRLLVVLPFEAEFYARFGVEATFVGHPLLDVLRDYRHDRRFATELGLPEDRFILGLLPGSRWSEIKYLLPILLKAAEKIDRRLEGITVAVAPAPSIPRETYESWQQRTPLPLRFFPGRTHEVMAGADLLLVASGTATLEAGIIGTPMIVTYKVSVASWLMTLLLVQDIKFCSLVNLVAGRELVPEILQWKVTPSRIARAAVSLYRRGGLHEMARTLADELRHRLGQPGAAGRAADEILALLAQRAR